MSSRPITSLVHLAVSALSFLFAPTPTSAQTAAVPVKQVFFNHRTGVETAYELKLRDGEPFEIRIAETCEPAFSYEIRGFLRPVQDSSRAGQRSGLMLTTKSIPVVHDAKYSGYLLTIAMTGDPSACENGENLQPRTVMISTPLQDWDIAFSGGFTVSTLKSPVFSLGPHPTVADRQQVRTNADQRDVANLGIASFVHIYHLRRPEFSPMFGLGIRDGNKMEYFLGGGYRFSDKATLNAGLVLGPVSRLPNGVNTTDPVTDNNVLTDLPTRTARGFFFGVSYSFIHVRDRLEKPFAGEASESGSQGARDTPRAIETAAAACQVEPERTAVALPAAGGSTTVKVVLTPTGCEPVITNQATWAPATLDASKTGLVFAAKANDTGKPQTHKLTVGGIAITLTQAAQ